MFSLICPWINGWVNNGVAGDLRCDHAHYDVIVVENEDHHGHVFSGDLAQVSQAIPPPNTVARQPLLSPAPHLSLYFLTILLKIEGVTALLGSMSPGDAMSWPLIYNLEKSLFPGPYQGMHTLGITVSYHFDMHRTKFQVLAHGHQSLKCADKTHEITPRHLRPMAIVFRPHCLGRPFFVHGCHFNIFHTVAYNHLASTSGRIPRTDHSPA